MTTGDVNPAAHSEPQKATSDSQPKKNAVAGAVKRAPTSQPEPLKSRAAEPCPRRALVIDDEPANRDFLVRLLEQAKLEVLGAESGQAALKITDGIGTLALVVIDHRLPDMDGVDLLVKLREKYPDARMIMATMLDERALMAKAFENGCNVFLVKPHGFMELFRRLQRYGPDDDELNRMIIDQYGLRPYRG
jgi:CheY-like chemotaxis protein